ncbi:DUF6891 domain-containing protein [Allonocardiopsis opalescens]|uniref:DUF6891 domain-containing protein n=1 Tax=Allonocardiopsis opalescens TaxID=1144618 RepID=A0A2T0QDA0_9ACTN|nr:hypothetical protein [Allonocardiopsis opalescens]PRY01907.1 hypothetical protein CLV72_101505 [Allonocardiopsis opalescens]
MADHPVSETPADPADTVLPVAVETERGTTKEYPTAAELSDLVEFIGADGDSWITFGPLPPVDARFAQTYRSGAGAYEVETREGADSEITATVLAEGDEVMRVFWDRIRAWAEDPARLPAEPPVPAEPGPEARAAAEATARAHVAAGFMGFPAVVRAVAQESSREGVSGYHARLIVRPLWERRLAEQAGWPERTDSDRLTEVFGELSAAGVVARENFTCCRSCGLAEIGAEADDRTRGFVFYHYQDTEAAAAGSGLYLAYGGFDGSEETTAAVGREVADALRGAGFQVSWDGSPSTRILVDPLEWRRRLPA